MFQLIRIIQKEKSRWFRVGHLKTVCLDLKKISDVVSKEVVKIRKFSKLNPKLNNLEKKILDAPTLT